MALCHDSTARGMKVCQPHAVRSAAHTANPVRGLPASCTLIGCFVLKCTVTAAWHFACVCPVCRRLRCMPPRTRQLLVAVAAAAAAWLLIVPRLPKRPRVALGAALAVLALAASWTSILPVLRGISVEDALFGIAGLLTGITFAVVARACARHRRRTPRLQCDGAGRGTR